MKPCWDVYGVVCPVTDYVMYIGIAQDVDKRLAQHKAKPESAIYEALQEVAQYGASIEDVKCVKFAHVHSKELALKIEEELIIVCPHTLNRTHQKRTEKFWKGIDREFGPPWWRKEPTDLSIHGG